MNFYRGDIVWVKFPFSDNSATKLRPALIISNDLVNKTGDYLMIQVTSVIRSDQFSLDLTSIDYKEEPLLKHSQLRLHKIFILNHTLTAGKITSVEETFLSKAVQQIIKLIS
jgi:mRNA interferase MazF